jgi:G8 domain
LPLEDTVRYWSDPNSWDRGYVPLEGEDVEIDSGKNFVFDLEVSPLYNMIEINGQVTFLQNATKLHLRAKYVFIRSGALIIGN